jgi:hypothetical protein
MTPPLSLNWNEAVLLVLEQAVNASCERRWGLLRGKWRAEWKTQRNKDLSQAGGPVSRVLRAYGFRHIQNIMRRLLPRDVEKSAKFAAVMACPSAPLAYVLNCSCVFIRT